MDDRQTKQRQKLIDNLTGSIQMPQKKSEPRVGPRKPSWWTGDDDASIASHVAIQQMRQRG